MYSFRFPWLVGWLVDQENEYVPAPGKVTRYSSPHNGSCWTHGNFVASPKRSGYFSLLPARPTLFFYELVTKDGFEGVVSCTPLGMYYFYLHSSHHTYHMLDLETQISFSVKTQTTTMRHACHHIQEASA